MFPGMEVCAKTGTAEVGGDKKPTGWIVGFSSKEETPLAFAVAVEEGNYGRTSAGTIASALMKAAVGQSKHSINDQNHKRIEREQLQR